MIKIEKTEVFGFEAAIRGARNPMNSWDKSDSGLNVMNPCDVEFGYEQNYEYIVGENDLKLMKSLSNAGNDHGKFLRMINVTVDITAPLYWWKEHDQYKVGTTTNSCSTMHKIHAKEFTIEDFSTEHLFKGSVDELKRLINKLNLYRAYFIDDYDYINKYDPYQTYRNCDRKDIWLQMIQLLPTSYNQKCTVQMNYQVLKSMYHARNFC